MQIQVLEQCLAQSQCPTNVCFSQCLVFYPHTRLAVWMHGEGSGAFLGQETGCSFPLWSGGHSTLDCSTGHWV